MKLHELKYAEGAIKAGRRVGRGQGSGGTTAGRGHKGSQSRSGYSRKIGFEGGQMPLQRRVPKFGFKSVNKVYFKCVNLDTLSLLAEQTGKLAFDVGFFVEHGIMGKKDKVKILGRGELKSKIDVTAHSFSNKATKTIEKLGGKAMKV